jgi:glycosyltransferase involved in cell wall biosynthesis
MRFTVNSNRVGRFPRSGNMVDQKKTKIALLGPSLKAVSGVSTHLNQLLHSGLADEFVLEHFQVGSEGRNESAARKLLRMAVSPFSLVFFLMVSRPDIVHLNTSLERNSYWRDLVYLLIAKIFRRRTVYQVHGGALPLDFFRKSRLLTSLLRWTLHQPDIVVLLAACEMAAYVDFAAGAKFELIANAVASESLNVNREPSSANAQLRITYIGRIVDSKGVFEAVEALGILRRRGVEVSLAIAGSGPAEARLRQKAADAGVADRVRFLGAIFGPLKDRLWRESDVFVFPTYHREGLPYAVLECMAAGCVPVVTRMGAIPDVVQNEVHGLFVESRNPGSVADALQKLNDRRDLLQNMAANCVQRIRASYTVERLAEDFRALYRRLK